MGDRTTPKWLVPLAVALACMMIAGFPGMNGDVVRICILLAGPSALAAAWFALGPKLKRRDKYDLGALREFDEQEELREIDLGMPSPEADKVVCPRCGNVYKARFPICPACKSRG